MSNTIQPSNRIIIQDGKSANQTSALHGETGADTQEAADLQETAENIKELRSILDDLNILNKQLNKLDQILQVVLQGTQN